MKLRKRSSQFLALETLEARRLLAAVTVANNTDDVNGDVSSVAALITDPGEDGVSLREAIEATNATPGADEIDFDFGHDGPEVIVLGGTELHISDDLTINGPGAELLAIDGNGKSRVMRVDDESDDQSSVSLSHVMITGGRADEQSEFGSGGGIFSRESLRITQSKLSENFAFRGGAVHSRMLELIESSLSGNTATREGGAIYSHDARVFRSIVSSNTAGHDGGGVYAKELTLNETSVKGNVAVDGSGGGARTAIYANISDSEFSNNSAAHGGGGLSGSMEVVVSGSRFVDNSAAGGGGLGGDSLTMTDSMVSGNQAKDGPAGGLAGNERLVLIRTLVVGNSSFGSFNGGYGGGVVARGVVQISNSAIRGNWAESGVGGLFQSTVIANPEECLIEFTSIVDNRVGDGVAPSIWMAGGMFSGAKTSILGSVIAGNTGSDLSDTPASLAHSLIGNNTNTELTESREPNADGNLIGRPDALVDPMLDENGVPLPGSPAIDAGNASLAVDADGNPLKWDARGEGFRRVLGYGVDIGAFESDGFLPGDANGDDVVNLADFNLLKAGFNQSGELSDGDFTGDGVVDLTDFNILKSNFGYGLEPDEPPADGTPISDEMAYAVAIDAAMKEDEAVDELLARAVF